MGTSRPLMPGVPAAGHVTASGFWHPGRAEGCVKCPGPEVKVIQRSDIARCPRRSLLPGHYRADGSCRCPTEEG
jgi:hypothetical protein